MFKAKHEQTDTEVIAQKILTSSFGTMWLSCDNNSLSLNSTEKRCKNTAPVQGQMEARVCHSCQFGLERKKKRKVIKEPCGH